MSWLFGGLKVDSLLIHVSGPAETQRPRSLQPETAGAQVREPSRLCLPSHRAPCTAACTLRPGPGLPSSGQQCCSTTCRHALMKRALLYPRGLGSRPVMGRAGLRRPPGTSSAAEKRPSVPRRAEKVPSMHPQHCCLAAGQVLQALGELCNQVPEAGGQGESRYVSMVTLHASL